MTIGTILLIAAGLLVLLWRLCDLSSAGLAYLYPLCEGEGQRLRRVFLRVPLRRDVRRDPALSDNKRRQA